MQINEHTWTRMMSAPASARPRATDAPMPLVPPVTRAVSPWREKREAMMFEWVCMSVEWESQDQVQPKNDLPMTVVLSRHVTSTEVAYKQINGQAVDFGGVIPSHPINQPRQLRISNCSHFATAAVIGADARNSAVKTPQMASNHDLSSYITSSTSFHKPYILHCRLEPTEKD